jgi:hypothetical protein
MQMNAGCELLACARLIEEGVAQKARDEEAIAARMAEIRAEALRLNLTIDCVAALYISAAIENFKAYAAIRTL